MLSGGLLFPVLASDVWTTEEYDVYSDSERGRTAIWRYGEDGYVFIDGLAGVESDLKTYHGYWVQAESSRRCDFAREGYDGEPTYYWGRFDIQFLDVEFPSRWQANIGLCDGPGFLQLNGTPKD